MTEETIPAAEEQPAETTPAELDVQQLHAVTNPEHRHAKSIEPAEIDIRGIGLTGAAGRPAVYFHVSRAGVVDWWTDCACPPGRHPPASAHARSTVHDHGPDQC